MQKENPVSVSPDISGSYEGYSLASCAYFQNNCSINETVTITKNSDGTANIAFSSGSWGEFTVASAQVDENGGVSNLSGNGQTQMGMGGNVSSYDCSFTAVIKSKEDAQMQFVVPAVMGGMTIDFQRAKLRQICCWLALTRDILMPTVLIFKINIVTMKVLL